VRAYLDLRGQQSDAARRAAREVYERKGTQDEAEEAAIAAAIAVLTDPAPEA
jgi:hypothetical protein